LTYQSTLVKLLVVKKERVECDTVCPLNVATKFVKTATMATTTTTTTTSTTTIKTTTQTCNAQLATCNSQRIEDELNCEMRNKKCQRQKYEEIKQLIGKQLNAKLLLI